MTTLLPVVLLVVGANLGCILTFDRAQRGLRDLGALWVRALAGKPVGSSGSA
jgi:hypothetical protein